jgi:hypothetical protein
MNMQPVESSNIQAIGYDPLTATLRVTFNNGTSYDYFGVAVEEHIDLMDAESKGKYLNACIKPNRKFAKVLAAV